MMLLLLLWLLLLLLVMVMCRGWWVGCGLAPSRRVRAWMGVVVGQEAPIGRRRWRTLTPHSLGWEGRLGILGWLIRDRHTCGWREGMRITGQSLGSWVLGGRGGGRTRRSCCRATGG